jgi:hypothetical protein
MLYSSKRCQFFYALNTNVLCGMSDRLHVPLESDWLLMPALRISDLRASRGLNGRASLPVLHT